MPVRTEASDGQRTAKKGEKIGKKKEDDKKEEEAKKKKKERKRRGGVQIRVLSILSRLSSAQSFKELPTVQKGGSPHWPD